MDYLTPVSTFFQNHIDFDHSDRASEAKRLIERQQLADKVLRGEAYHDELLDCLAEQGLDPIEYALSTINEIESVMNRGEIIEGWQPVIYS